MISNRKKCAPPFSCVCSNACGVSVCVFVCIYMWRWEDVCYSHNTNYTCLPRVISLTPTQQGHITLISSVAVGDIIYDVIYSCIFIWPGNHYILVLLN